MVLNKEWGLICFSLQKGAYWRGGHIMEGARRSRSLYLLYCALESTLSRGDLCIKRLSGEVSHAHSSKTQSNQS